MGKEGRTGQVTLDTSMVTHFQQQTAATKMLNLCPLNPKGEHQWVGIPTVGQIRPKPFSVQHSVLFFLGRLSQLIKTVNLHHLVYHVSFRWPCQCSHKVTAHLWQYMRDQILVPAKLLNGDHRNSSS